MHVMTDAEVTYPPRTALKRHGCVDLGRHYFVYEFESKLLVRHARRRRPHETLERCYELRSVHALGQYYAGRTVTVEQALQDLRTGIVQVPIISYRPHARRDLLDMFIGLCAMGRAAPRHAGGHSAFAIAGD